MKIHSVNDTLEVAIPSLQTVTSDVQLSLRVRTKCACKRRLSKAEHLSRSAFAYPHRFGRAHEDILKNFDSACKSSASLIIASTLRQATCQACHEVMSPGGLLFPKSFAFVLESHTQAHNTCVFDLLGRELQLDDFSKNVYRVAALVIHSQTRQHYCTLEFADAGLAYPYDTFRGSDSFTDVNSHQKSPPMSTPFSLTGGWTRLELMLLLRLSRFLLLQPFTSESAAAALTLQKLCGCYTRVLLSPSRQIWPWKPTICSCF